MSANRSWTRDLWESNRKRDRWDRWRDRKFARNVFASMCWSQCFEFDRFESRWDHRIEVWRNATLYEITIAFVKNLRRERTHLMSLQVKWTRLFSEHVKQIVHSEIESRWCRDSRRSERSKRTIDCRLLRDIAHRFECRNRKTWELRCHKSWRYFCSWYRLSWCCNRRNHWRSRWCTLRALAHNFWCRNRERWKLRWCERWEDYRLRRWDLRIKRNNWLRLLVMTSTNMLVKLDVAIEFNRMLATSACIFLCSLLSYSNFLLLFQWLLRFLFDLALHFQLVLSHKIFFLYLFRLNESTVTSFQSFDLSSCVRDIAIEDLAFLNHSQRDKCKEEMIKKE